MIKEFSVSEWIVKGVLIAIGFMIAYMLVVFLLSSFFYWLEIKRILVIDALMRRPL